MTADEQRLLQVVNNLVANALDHAQATNGVHRTLLRGDDVELLRLGRRRRHGAREPDAQLRTFSSHGSHGPRPPERRAWVGADHRAAPHRPPWRDRERPERTRGGLDVHRRAAASERFLLDVTQTGDDIGMAMPTSRRDIVVVGASAGGVEALTQLVRELPADFDAAMFVVLHVPRGGTSALPIILKRASALPVAHARHGQRIESRHIYVAPPDHHLILKKDGVMHLTRGPEENGMRPAVDPLFRSAARTYGPRVIGVVLSGSLDDGTAGLAAVKMRGGIAIVQDPKEAAHGSMPRNALENVAVDHVARLGPMAKWLGTLTAEEVAMPDPPPNVPPARDPGATKRALEQEVDVASFDDEAAEDASDESPASPFSCPQCHGTLFDHTDGPLPRFRCRVGHAYSLESLEMDQRESLDDALWIAYRALKENAAIARRLSEQARSHGRTTSADLWEARARSANERADIIHRVLGREEPSPGGTEST